MVTPVAMEPTLGYHPYSTGFLTCSRNPAGGQCLTDAKFTTHFKAITAYAGNSHEKADRAKTVH